MTYTISGKYVGSCSCLEVCPCPYDGPPKNAAGKNECRGAVVFHIDRGDLDGLDLSGVNIGLFNFFPSNFTSGKWTIGAVVDEGASDDQVKAIEAILSGQAGGPFAEMAPLIGEFLGIERGKITYKDGDSPSASVAGMTDIGFTPYQGPDGTPTKVKNAPFGFAPEFLIGKASGKTKAFGGRIAYDAIYGEAAEFTYSSEMAGEVRPRA